ncbi:XRE family transcriptional regulator [Pseudomonas putida]|uniref:XRE family transcriptional regulator n=1 Tax=Pseudomonas putida TaxID=303 RepID=UPI001ED9D693|nr:helix-turn-helix transcriptional regulator [Pseudomonas putida]
MIDTMKSIGERIAQKREQAGLNQSELGRRLGLTAQAVQKWESGKSTPRNSKLHDIASILGTTVSFLVGEEVEQSPGLVDIDTWDEDTPLRDDETEVPLLREIELSAGSGRVATEDGRTAPLRFGKRNLRHNGVQFNQATCFTVRGNSMLPVLRDGATVGVNTAKNSITDIIDGDLYALNHNGLLRIKQLYRLPKGIRLRSFNRDEHPDEDYSFEQMADEQIVILGHVFWWGMYAR